ncbi:hypothetical protein ACQKP0_20685 [Heyndrickxia sp. NPDC080065]|uniref:hypothetical protein n=1 Tax=Heyndrickxia sp. NPDC080065 TaxID=3390568 RepID=UPI003D00D765
MPFYPQYPGRGPLQRRPLQRGPFMRSVSLPTRNMMVRSSGRHQLMPRSSQGPGGYQKVFHHVGNVTNGINMLRQLGSFLPFFK